MCVKQNGEVAQAGELMYEDCEVRSTHEQLAKETSYILNRNRRDLIPNHYLFTR